MPSTIDTGFFPEIKKRAADAGVANVQTILGKFTDPALPATRASMSRSSATMLHHVEDRQGYLKALTRYLSPRVPRRRCGLRGAAGTACR
mgnify:CR=1 FL=1